jgi:hypothetical protein
MAVRDLLWGCPLCRAPGGIRRNGRRERCRECGATFRRGQGARIVAERDGVRQHHSAGEWLVRLGPVEAPTPDATGRILGPERVRVKVTRRQEPLHWGGGLLGWVEVYDRAMVGELILDTDGLLLQPARGGSPERWKPQDLTGIQPASSAIQIGLHDRMASVKFVDGSVRLWTRALTDLLREYYRATGRDVLEFQPFLRTCALTRSGL